MSTTLHQQKTTLKGPVWSHFIFWLCVFLYFFFTINIAGYYTYQQNFESAAIIIVLQLITAYTCLYFLIPFFFTKKKYIQFTILLAILLVSMFAIYTCFKAFYYDPSHIVHYNVIELEKASLSFWERFLDISMFLSKTIKFLAPLALLLMARFYKNQQRFTKLNEQKKIAELTALKHQLNPHFLFNTLNNIYTLALKKSNNTPEAIAKLSDILDYMLYGCNGTFVPLDKEISLIENYLSLEKIRYGERVNIDFKTVVDEGANIAPLLLLTLVENAFKHGVSQELEIAFIDINITSNKDTITFTIKNSIPKGYTNKTAKQPLGLQNVRKQLELLYNKAHTLDINEEKDVFLVDLKLKNK